MKANLTELVFILDRSGSMAGLESDTIGGFNAMLEKQQAESGDCKITTVLFDNDYEVLHDRIEIKAVSPMTEKQYYVRGSTALLDAVGKTINKIGNAQKNTTKEYRAEKVVFVITTDGMENASREFSYDKIRTMIENQKEKYNWEFIFLGANIDAVRTASSIGICKSRAQNFHNDSAGIGVMYDIVGETLSAYRSAPRNSRIEDNWGENIEKDFEERKKKV